MKMVPHHHFDDPATWLRYQCKSEVCGCVEHARDGGVIPVPGFPRVNGMAKEEERASGGSNMVQT